ncbi:MAG: hypothetical protein ACREYF_23620 [Gammaproteobacteria bacterium]
MKKLSEKRSHFKAKTIAACAALTLALLTGTAPASAADLGPAPIITPLPSACAGGTAGGRVKALTIPGLYTAHRDFSGGIEDGMSYLPGTFGATPLFKTTVSVSGTTKACVLATLSVNAEPNDNGMVFQVRIDGNPMSGHWNPVKVPRLLEDLPFDFNVPIVWLPNVVYQPGLFEAIDPPHLAAYTFSASVAPGAHTIEVRVAGCCHQDLDVPASAPDGYVRSATLALQYR